MNSPEPANAGQKVIPKTTILPEGSLNFSSQMSEKEFNSIRTFIYDSIGVNLTPEKSIMVASRLTKRLRHYGLKSYGEYFNLLLTDQLQGEKQIVVDLLTTNETSFFREPWHFDYLREHVYPQYFKAPNFKCWSAACSSGEEVYTLAMSLAQHINHCPWEILGSDINDDVLNRAMRGHYSIEGATNIPQEYLKRYCLKGFGPQEGMFSIDPALKQKIKFRSLNLTIPNGMVNTFDIVFLRNVLIYFDRPTKKVVIDNILSALKPRGYLFIGHSESLKDFSSTLELVSHTVYRKL